MTRSGRAAMGRAGDVGASASPTAPPSDYSEVLAVARLPIHTVFRLQNSRMP